MNSRITGDILTWLICVCFKNLFVNLISRLFNWITYGLFDLFGRPENSLTSQDWHQSTYVTYVRSRVTKRQTGQFAGRMYSGRWSGSLHRELFPGRPGQFSRETTWKYISALSHFSNHLLARNREISKNIYPQKSLAFNLTYYGFFCLPICNHDFSS